MTDPMRVLSMKAIVVWSAGLLALAAASVVLLLSVLGGGSPEDSARLEVLRTAANIVVGAGGAAALLLAARRQRSTELDLVQKDHDATQRRVTEMYGKAADQLGSDKAPVRLAGLYALERLAADHPSQRQTVVNLLCAYLRMPFDLPNREETQVRKAAQRVLMLHLRPGRLHDSRAFWPDIDLDFAGAHLVDFTLSYCVIRSAVFAGTVFTGETTFHGTAIATKADFTGAEFEGEPDFTGVEFPGPVPFTE